MLFLTDANLTIPKKLAASFAKVRDAIERDDFKSPDVKKLASRELYRAKLDYENRLLLRFVRYREQRACLALELVENHAYDRARFLRGARLDEATELEAGEQTPASVVDGPVRYLDPRRTEFHMLDKPISFDDRQSELFDLPLPMVLVGCAGSGKTALTLTKLRGLEGQVLYVTHSAFLAETAAGLYFAHGFENADQDVDFLSYRKLLESIEVPVGRAVTLDDFRGFFDRHRSTLKHTNAHQIFEELRGVVTASPGGPLTLDAYLALGVRQSIYQPAERAAVHALLSKYREFLTEKKLYDTNLLAQAYATKAEKRYDAVVVDEVQDLTNAELALVLAVLRAPSQFLLCGDANQIVHPNFFSWSKVKSLFFEKETDAVSAPIHVLDANYRSSTTVCTLANTLLEVKNARFGSIDRESTSLVRPVSEIAGRVAGLVNKPSVLRELDAKIRASTRVAVIVLDEERKIEAKRAFSTPLVFSVHEAKGLEYDTVILYDLVSAERVAFKEIANGVSAGDLGKDALVYARAKDKTDKSLEVYKFYVNALYVALTRAVETVYIVESDTTHPLHALLRVSFSEDTTSLSAAKSSLEEWEREARKLELQGKREQADAIKRQILRVTEVPWKVLDDKGLDETIAKAFEPNSVFTKAKVQLFDFAAFHELAPLARRVELMAKYQPPRPLALAVEAAKERFLTPYRDRDSARVLADISKYGVEHRNMMALTPLMLAAAAGNVTLVETLLERGARLDAVDTFGRYAFHFALRAALRDSRFASSKLGPLYDLLCPTGIDLQVDGRLVRLARNQGEFFVLALMMASFHDLYDRYGLRPNGLQAPRLDAMLAHFPPTVVPDERRKRTYWNAVLARGELDSTYRPARRLWKRERQGHYVPADLALLRVTDDRGEETYRSLADLLRKAWLDDAAARQITCAAPRAAARDRLFDA